MERNEETEVDVEVIDERTGECTAVIPQSQGSAPLVNWEKAAQIGIEAKKARDAIIRGVLRRKADFDSIPGCGTKPVLLKPGAEKIADALNLCDEYEELIVVEDFDKPLFHYRIRCSLVERNTRVVVTTGIGSCNSMEDKYRWRKSERVCPSCGASALIKDKFSKDDYKDGWLCWAKKGGCGLKFQKDDADIINQQVGRVANDDIFSLVNTLSKMAQKRAKVAAVLNLGFSEQFTQDIEDNSTSFGGTNSTQTQSEQEGDPEIIPADKVCETIGKMKTLAKLESKQKGWFDSDKSDYTDEEALRISKAFEVRIAIFSAGSNKDAKITTAQAQRLYSIGAFCKPTPWTHDAIKAHIKEKYGWDTAKDLTVSQYNEVEKFIGEYEAEEPHIVDDLDKALTDDPKFTKDELIAKLTELGKVKEIDVGMKANLKFRTTNLNDLAVDQLSYLLDVLKGD